MDTETYKRNQKIVYVGLRRMSNDRNLIIDGFSYWTQKLSSDDFDVNNIVSELVSYMDLDSANKKSLMVAMHAASNRMTEDLPAVPQALIDRTGTKAGSANMSEDNVDSGTFDEVQAAKPPHCVVTTVYMQSLVRLLTKQDFSAFEDCKNILLQEGLQEISEAFQQNIIEWAVEGLMALEIPESTSEADCKSAAHELYLLLTELIGPMDADNLVDAAIAATMKLDEAARFSPKLLV